jgi:hypothetical protein
MIKKNFEGDFEITCNECGAVITSNAVTFEEAIQELKELGWTAVLVAVTWENTCPDCN